MMPPLLKHLHSKTIRKRMEKKINALGQSGDLVKLADLMVSKEVVESDAKGFKRAKDKYRYLQQKLAYLNDKSLRRKRGFQVGMRFARRFSIFVFSAVNHCIDI